MITTDIAQRLAGLGMGAYGVDVVDTAFPEDLNNGLMVRDYAGRPGQYEHDQNTPAVRYARLQIVARNESVEAAYTAAETAYSLIHDVHNLTINGTRYGAILALQQPFWLRQDDSGRHYVVFNAEATLT